MTPSDAPAPGDAPGTLQMHWPEANVLISADVLDPGGLVPDYTAVVRVEVGA